MNNFFGIRQRLTRTIFLVIFFIFTPFVYGQYFLNLEGNAIWQSRNEFGIPGDTGTRIDLANVAKGPVGGYRIYIGKKWSGHHELRALFAPLSLKTTWLATEEIVFQNQNFVADSAVEAFYKFNSYRLGYTYFFDALGSWTFGLGFTAKIRDAEIRLSQGTVSESKKNVGFVPLLRAEALYTASENNRIRMDLEGLAAPQGRAFDLSLKWEHFLTYFGAGHSLYGFLGYRTVEGGADNSVVFNFAWFHALSAGLSAEF